MKFIHVLTVPMSLAALTVMGGATSCEDLAPQRACRISDVQEMQFFGGDATCQRIRFCDEVKSSFVGVDESLYEPTFLETVEPYDGRVYLTNWLYYDAGQLCSGDSAQVVPNVPATKDFTLNVNLKRRADAEQFSVRVHAVLTTIDFAPKVSNATHQVQLGGRNVAVFVQPTAVTELKLQANLTQTPAAGTISYQLPEMPATMTTVPAANAEAIVSVSQGIAVGEGATVKATLEADGETIEREAEVRVVARSDDPIVDVRPTDVSNCARFACGETKYSRACFSTAESLPSIDGTRSGFQLDRAEVLGRDGGVLPQASATVVYDRGSSFLLCYYEIAEAVRVRAVTTGTTDLDIAYDYLFDPTTR